MSQVNFATSGAFVWVGEHELDSARLTIRRFGVAYVRGNSLDEADLVELHNAIRRVRS